MASSLSARFLLRRWPCAKNLLMSTLKSGHPSSPLRSRFISILCMQRSSQKFTKDHEWISNDNGIGTMGITDYAQGSLGDVVFVELPELDSNLAQGDNCGTVESVKAVSELYSPVSGTVTEVNEKLLETPELINSSAQADGWIMKVKLEDPTELDQLMNEDEYQQFVKESEES